MIDVRHRSCVCKTGACPSRVLFSFVCEVSLWTNEQLTAAVQVVRYFLKENINNLLRNGALPIPHPFVVPTSHVFHLSAKLLCGQMKNPSRGGR